MITSVLPGDHVAWVAAFGPGISSLKEIANALANGRPAYAGRVATVTRTDFTCDDGQKGAISSIVAVVPSLAAAQAIATTFTQISANFEASRQRAIDQAIKTIERTLPSLGAGR